MLLIESAERHGCPANGPVVRRSARLDVTYGDHRLVAVSHVSRKRARLATALESWFGDRAERIGVHEWVSRHPDAASPTW
jgi:hypothetical protein